MFIIYCCQRDEFLLADLLFVYSFHTVLSYVFGYILMQAGSVLFCYVKLFFNMLVVISGCFVHYFFLYVPGVLFVGSRTMVASTHGDHSVRLSAIATGRCKHALIGHPRTPWTVAFHPCFEGILASGCLGGHVRVWDLKVSI